MVDGAICTYIEGLVAQANEFGVLLEGETAWRNVGKWTTTWNRIPLAGTRVRLGLDKSGHIQAIDVLDRQSGEPTATVLPRPIGSFERDLRILREAVLNTAVAILSSHGAVDPDDVLELAARLEAWVLC